MGTWTAWILLLLSLTPMPLLAGDAVERLRAAQARIGSPDTVPGGWILAGRGEFDLAARNQGLAPGSPHWVPYEEVLAFDEQTLVYESHGRVNADADEWLRFRIDGRGVLLSDRLNLRAFWLTDLDAVDQRARYRRFLPDALLAEALETARPDTPVNRADFLGRQAWRVPFSTGDGTRLSLFLDDHHQLLGFRYALDMPLLGDTDVTWRYTGDAEITAGVRLPSGYEVSLGHRLMKRIRFDHQWGRSLTPWTRVPDDIKQPPPPASGDDQGGSEARLEFRPVADSVWVVPDARPGFHVLVIEAGDDLVVVDAPAGWFELQQVPAMNWVAGASSSSTARRLLDALAEQFPGRRVSHLILTHHHTDHAGGVRPFVAAGAVLVVSRETRAVVEQAVRARFTLAPDALTDAPRKPEFQVVESTWIHPAGVEVHAAPGNPHAHGMLVVYLPGPRLIYQSDLFEPAPDPYFPSRERLPVMRWFVHWLDEFGQPVDRVTAIHGSFSVTPEQLELVRQAR